MLRREHLKATQHFKEQVKGLGEDELIHIQVPETEKQVGLRNLSNLCYLNAIIQCLKVLDSRNWVSVNAAVAGTSVRTSTVWEEYLRLIDRMKTGRKSICAPYDLRNAIAKAYPRFDTKVQQDAHELAMMLLESLSAEHAQDWGGKGWEDSTLGELCSTTTCTVCKTSSKKKETFNILSLEMSPGSEVESITECLMEFEKEESLLKEEGEGWNCPTCGRCESAVKQLVVQREPKDLILHLKRFGFKSGGRKLSKEILVQLSIELRATKYKLRGIVHHSGKTLLSGHYIAEVRNGNEWSIYDDQSVSATVRSVDRPSHDAYMLFYSVMK